MIRITAILTSLSLSACAAGHGLTGTPVNVTPNLPEAPASFKAQTADEAPLLSNWLEQFDDLEMINIVNEALASNPDIVASQSRVEAARQNARAVFGRSLPSVGFTFNNGFSSSFNSQALGGGVVVDGRFSQPSFSNALQFAWEVDLWGRVRAGNLAARAEYVATEADLSGAQLSIGGQAAVSWINFTGAQEQVRIAEDTVEARSSVVYLTERRFASGLSTALDVRTARSQLATAQAQVAAQLQTRNETARGLEILLGRYPAAEIDAPSRLPELNSLQRPESPASLLSRRPDLAAAEARLEASGLQAEAARLAIFPALNASAGISNNSSIVFTDIFDPRRISANIFASLTQNIWNGGAIKAERRAALANAEALASTYVSTVLNAWREVEDALDADRLLAVQEAAQREALEEATLAEGLATRQYQNGLVDIFNLLTAQTTRLTAKASLTQAITARAVNRVNYHMALGGGLAQPGNPSQNSDTAPTTATLASANTLPTAKNLPPESLSP